MSVNKDYEKKFFCISAPFCNTKDEMWHQLELSWDCIKRPMEALFDCSDVSIHCEEGFPDHPVLTGTCVRKSGLHSFHFQSANILNTLLKGHPIDLLTRKDMEERIKEAYQKGYQQGYAAWDRVTHPKMPMNPSDEEIRTFVFETTHAWAKQEYGESAAEIVVENQTSPEKDT